MKNPDQLVCMKAYQPYYTDEYENVYYVLTSINDGKNSLLPIKQEKGFLLEVEGVFTVDESFPFLRRNKKSTISREVYLVEAIPALKYIRHNTCYPQTIAIPIKGAKRNRIEILSSEYIAFDNQIFVSSMSIDEVDIETFSIYPNSMFSKDKNRVYYKNMIVKKADPKTFEVISAQFQRDNEHVWYMGSLLCADSQSFKVFTCETSAGFNKDMSLYACDKNRVYYQYLILDDADIKTFRVLRSAKSDELYGVDEKRVFYHHMYLEYADAKSFRVITNQQMDLFDNPNVDAFDDNYKYVCGNREPLTIREKNKIMQERVVFV